MYWINNKLRLSLYSTWIVRKSWVTCLLCCWPGTTSITFKDLLNALHESKLSQFKAKKTKKFAMSIIWIVMVISVTFMLCMCTQHKWSPCWRHLSRVLKSLYKQTHVLTYGKCAFFYCKHLTQLFSLVCILAFHFYIPTVSVKWVMDRKN